jgi:hypothetical protein
MLHFFMLLWLHAYWKEIVFTFPVHILVVCQSQLYQQMMDIEALGTVL